MEDRPFTLIALGDCNTSGVAAAAGQTVPALVAAGLTENSAATCTMVNLGFTMSTTREGRAKLRDDTGPVDLLLVNYGLARNR